MNLHASSTIKEIRQKYNLQLSKSLGQNVITDGNVIDSIIEGAGIGPDDLVIEIGPGIGVLTAAAAETAAKVVAIEIDSRLIPILEETLAIVAVAIVDNHGLGGILSLNFRHTDIATAHEEAGDEVGRVDAGTGGGAVGVVAVAPGVAVDGATLGGGGDIEIAVAVERTVAGDRGGAYGEAAGEKEGSDAEE